MITKLKAGALQLVTFIVVVIALLLSAFLILMHVHKQFRLQTNHTIETIRLADQGIQYALSNTIEIQDTVGIDLFDEQYKSLQVKKGFWGVYEMLYSESRIKQQKFDKIALAGTQQQEPRTALFLKDNGKPLVLVGTSRITGLSYLPKRGIKSGNIDGHSYYGVNYVNGIMEQSHGFPDLNINLRQHIDALVNGTLRFPANMEFLDLGKTRHVSNSFKSPLLLAHSNKAIVLSEMELDGHIIVRSNTRIIVEDTALLKHILLIAPHIDIKKNVKGTFQAFATKSIAVSENVTLDYPSALVLNNHDEVADKDCFVEVGARSNIKGSVLYLGNTKGHNYEVQIKIAQGAIVEGEVYCEQNLELRGNVLGSVYTNNCIVKEKGTTYQNHMYNGSIDSKKLTEQYVGALLEDDAYKGIVAWLY